ncbi:MAG: hypothetical protein JXA06_00250, partial [Bacteroidetes bacterium]|nr:hypothetical protein [Bacteroidota bacterium]
MKIWLILILFGIIPLRMHSQNITPDERQAYIDSLDSQDEIERYKALNEIHRLKIIEALPKIESVFWKADVSFQVFSFLVFDAFNSSNLCLFAKAYYDSAIIIANRVIIIDSSLNLFLKSPYSTLQLKAEMTHYLHKCGNYSTTSNVFEYLRNGGKNAKYDIQETLKSIIKNVPEYADSAKYWLIKITKEPDIMASRIQAMYDLVELYGKEMYPVIVTMVTDTGDIGTRLMAYDLLYKTSYPNLHDLLKDRLLKETDPYLRYVIADSLLFHYGSVADYVFVKNYNTQETDPKMKSWIEKSIRDYEPPKPDISYTIIQMLDSLAHCLQQVAGYGWIGDVGFVAEMNNYIVTAKNKAVINDSINCTRYVLTFKQRINEEYVDSLDNDKKFITIDGWKFLYYNAQYILDRLPQIPAESAADMLDTLSSRLQMSYSNNWIGSQTFVRILEKNIQNAKSKYTAKDSIGCAQEIESFYKLVRLRYLAPGMQFVKTEAYNLLYNYAR